jgi:hypothetical protein
VRVQSTARTPQETREVEPKLTAVSRGDLRAAIARAHTRVTGQAPSPGLLDILTAHASLETASGAKMFNFNFGGIKGQSASGETARYKTHEVIDGKDTVVRDGFRAYGSLDEGAADYVRLMRGRFGAAVSAAQGGNVDGFAHALKQAGYYTADEHTYASALHSLTGGTAHVEHHEPIATLGAALGNTNIALPDSTQVERFMDALAHHRHVVSEEDDSSED